MCSHKTRNNTVAPDPRCAELMRSNKKEHRKKMYLEQCSLFPLKKLTLQRTILYKIIQNKNGEEGSRINIRGVQQILGVYHKISIHSGMSATGVNCYL